jgi:chaperonin GroES
MNVIPLYDRILVRPADTATRYVREDATVEPGGEEPIRGTVIAAGTGALDGDGQAVPLAVHAGDTVLFGRHLGCEVTFGGVQYWMLKAEDIVRIEARAITVVLADPRRLRRDRHAA